MANLLTRDDTFFGVCEGLGEDTGIPSNIFRLALAGFLFFYPVQVVAIYLAAGVLVALLRWTLPAGTRSKADTAAVVEADTTPERLPLAA